MVFAGFVRAAGLGIDPLDHENMRPPFPDIRIVINNSRHYLELVEVADQALAKSTADAAKMGSSECVWFEDDQTTIMHLLRVKCARQYRGDGDPVDLILYFGVLPPRLSTCTFNGYYQAEIRRLMRGSGFSKVWIYDNRGARILLKLERDPVAQGNTH